MISLFLRLFMKPNISYYYLFEIYDKNKEITLRLTNNDKSVTYNDHQYQALSNLNIESHSKTDSGLDQMKISGNFVENGIDQDFDTSNVVVNILISNSDQTDAFAYMTITESEIMGYKFHWSLEPISLKLKNSPANKFYSKNCRVSFCSAECGLLLDDYIQIFLAYQTRNNYITLEEVVPDHFINGFAILSGEKDFKAKILDIKDYSIILDKQIPHHQFTSLKLVASCDKSLVTCKKVFNNIINFRGEPHIPESDKLKII